MNDDRRFFAKVELADDCWVWVGARNDRGYGEFSIRSRRIKAHRWSYEYLRAEIPEGLSLDHLCRNRACVNPWHLEPVTRSVNLRRGNTTRTHCSSRTHCPYGHPYDAENTAMRGGHRTCKSCARDRATAARAKKKAAA